MSLWFSDRERKRLKEKIEYQKREAEAIYPLAFLVATDTISNILCLILGGDSVGATSWSRPGSR